MEKPNKAKLRLLSYAVIAYMMLAFVWWSVLLFTKNQDAFQAKRDKIQLLMIADGAVSSNEEFYATAEYIDLKRQYKRQEYMILGEAIVFTISLLTGLWLINRGYNREVDAAQQQRNFLLSITHELKSPIASIQLVLETMQKRVLPKDKKEKLTQSALFETTRLNTLVNDLLFSAKLERAYQPFIEDIDLAQLMEDTIGRMEAKYPNVSFSFHKQTAIPNYRGDQAGMSSIIINLLENAVKYSTSPIEIEANIREEEGQIVLEIADNGIGISDKEKAKIFDKFYRVGDEDIRKTKGTGLGLYIVNQIVMAHRGQIDVLNNKPNGSRFVINLPLT
jgi:two-component system phosphate regulon sensor histidine kinase PhoR